MLLWGRPVLLAFMWGRGRIDPTTNKRPNVSGTMKLMLIQIMNWKLNGQPLPAFYKMAGCYGHLDGFWSARSLYWKMPYLFIALVYPFGHSDSWHNYAWPSSGITLVFQPLLKHAPVTTIFFKTIKGWTKITFKITV